MSELRLDYQPNTAFPLLGAALLAIATASLMLLGAHYSKLNERVASAEAKFSHSQNNASKGNLSAAVSTELGQEVNNANEVLHQLSVPWETCFKQLKLLVAAKLHCWH
jgi:hypothetical protein